MSTLFKTQIKNIRKEALELGFSIKTMDGYLNIWNNFIKWKNEDNFIYNESEYSNFLLDYYHFDVHEYNNKTKSRFQQLMRSKRILDNFDEYKEFMQKRVLPKSLYSQYSPNWNTILDHYLDYCNNIRYNSKNTVKIKRDYLECVLSYLYQNKILELKDITKTIIVNFVNENIEKGNISKRRCFYVFRDFLKYLFIEDILESDLSIYIPKIKSINKKKIPTYLKQDDIENLLNSITKNTKIEIRDYTIILIAARLGLRISDILNIKLKDIDWKNHKLNIIQPKTKNLNILPLSNEVGWEIINYIKKSRPKCNNEYLFVKMKYPFDKMIHFQKFNKYFKKANIEIKNNNKKGIHNLRHSLATNMLNYNIPLSIISSTLGDTLETTSNTYLKVDVKNLSKCNLEVDE